MVTAGTTQAPFNLTLGDCATPGTNRRAVRVLQVPVGAERVAGGALALANGHQPVFRVVSASKVYAFQFKTDVVTRPVPAGASSRMASKTGGEA